MSIFIGVIIFVLFIVGIMQIEKMVTREIEPTDPTTRLPGLLPHLEGPDWEESRQQLIWLVEKRLPELKTQLMTITPLNNDHSDILSKTLVTELNQRIDKIHSLVWQLDLNIQKHKTFLDPADTRLFIAETFCALQP